MHTGRGGTCSVCVCRPLHSTDTMFQGSHDLLELSDTPSELKMSM